MEDEWFNAYLDKYFDRLIINGTGKVEIGYNNLCELPPKLFQVSEALSLDLNLNHLTEASFSLESFSSNSFQGWKKLESLDLEGNKLSKLPTGLTPTFFPSLKSLNLSNNPLDLSDDLFDPSQLSEGQVALLGQLEGLKIQDSRLRSAPKKFLSLCPKLNHIAIRFNCLSSDDLSFLIENYPGLTKVHLSSNPIASISPSIRTLTNLKKLDISACGLKVLPDEIGNLVHLVKLKAENNFLEHLPDSMINLKRLRKLYLFGNMIARLPTVIVDYDKITVRLPQLRLLDLSSTDILLTDEISDHFCLGKFNSIRIPRVQPDPSDGEDQEGDKSDPSYDSDEEELCRILIDVRKGVGPDLILEESGSKKPLYLGRYDNAYSHRTLDEIGAKSILTVGNRMRPVYPLRYTYKVVDIDDEENENLKQHFHDCIDFIDRERENGSVLVHCAAGISRSASTVIAYLMKTQGLSYSEARSHVQQRRRIICPNSGFVKQLIQFEEELKNSGSSLQLS